LGGEGSENRDRYADSSADERLPQGKYMVHEVLRMPHCNLVSCANEVA
jgi:hypothetical protein